jgi:hypothetical protein
MASKEQTVSKETVAGTTRNITLIITETLEIIIKPRNATSQVIMAAYKTGFLTIYGIKKQEDKITCKNLGQYRCCVINGTFNNSAPFQSRGYQIKEILLP